MALKGQTMPDNRADGCIPGSDWPQWYRALRYQHPDAFKKAINYMESVTIQYRIPERAAAEYERAAVMMLCEVLEVSP